MDNNHAVIRLFCTLTVRKNVRINVCLFLSDKLFYVNNLIINHKNLGWKRVIGNNDNFVLYGIFFWKTKKWSNFFY